MLERFFKRKKLERTISNAYIEILIWIICWPKRFTNSNKVYKRDPLKRIERM